VSARCPRFASAFWTLTRVHCTLTENGYRVFLCPAVCDVSSNPGSPISSLSVVTADNQSSARQTRTTGSFNVWQATEQVVEDAKKLTSGAKAPTHFRRLSGPTEVGPSPKPARIIVFQQPVGGRALSLRHVHLRIRGHARACASAGTAPLKPKDGLSGPPARLRNCRGRPLGLCGQRLPELDLIPIRVIDPGKATVGFIHSFGVNLYSLLF
jgi:hypothetical protein